MHRNHSRENSWTIIKWLHDSVVGEIHKWILLSCLNLSSFKNKQTSLHEAWIVLRPPESSQALRQALSPHSSWRSVLGNQIIQRSS